MGKQFCLRNLVAGAMIAVCALGFQSCLDDDDEVSWGRVLPNALVTVKPLDDGSFYLQLDDSTTLLPVNLTSSPFGAKEVRALTNFEETDDPSGLYDKAVSINWIDSLLTKSMAADLGEAANDSIYGSDPVEIVNDWVTIAEDGYLTLRFRTVWGNTGQAHFVNLLSTGNPEDPYEVEFRHNAYGDVSGRLSDGLVAFRLDSLPDTNGQTVKLTLRWKSFEGDKSAQFNYCTRKSTGTGDAIASERSVLNLR